MSEHKSLTEALVAFQAELPSVAKGNTADVPTKSGGKYSYQYADLTDVTEAIMPVLSKHGLSFSSRPTMSENGFVLAYALRHTNGDEDTGEYPLPDPAHNPAQTIGSAISYARRYCLCAATGVAPGGDDDDAQGAQGADRTRRTKQARQQDAAANVAIQKINHAANLEALKEAWETIPAPSRALVAVMQAKDARKEALSVPVDERWAPVAEIQP